MKSKENQSHKTNLEQEIDKLGDIWDAMLAKGDDEFYEAAKPNRERLKNEEGISRRSRRRGKRM